MRPSFSLLELVVVITVTGIIMGSTFQLLFNIYGSYRYIRDMSYLDIELSNASMEIIKLMENRIIGSTIESNETNFSMISGDFFYDHNQNIQWIGRAYDSYLGSWSEKNGTNQPNWSGFLDLSLDHTDEILYLDDTNISVGEEMIYLLSNGEVNISDPTSSSPPAIFFKGVNDPNRDGFGWKESILGDSNASEYAYIGYFDRNSSEQNLPFKSMSSTKFSDNVSPLKIVEQYYLSWTAYGLQKEREGDQENLYLYYNYRPWNGEEMSATGSRTLLLENVTEFFYSATGTTFKIHICISNGVDGIDEVIFCRDSLVY